MKGQAIEITGKNGTYAFDPKQALSQNGRFGSVFKGVDRISGLPVVVKFFNPQRGNKAAEYRFKTEALYAFGRPDIQDALDYVVDNDRLFLVKQYIPGKSLKEVKTGKISFAEMKGALLSLCDTLGFLHDKGIIHADIKPANIIWHFTEKEQPRQPVLIDFGLARWDKLQYADSLFSFIYSPPEQVLGFGGLMGPWGDFFSLGITVYETLTGEPVYDFDTESGPAILEQAQLAYPLPKHSALPPDWYAFLLYLCQKPLLRKPHHHYSRPELQELLAESLERRPKNAHEVKERVAALSTDAPRKSRWKIFG